MINPLAKPLQIGIYKDNLLVDLITTDEMTSDILLPLLKELLQKYEISKIIYANGPGSHMATKITYVLLKTLNLIKDIPVFAVSGFELNNNKPIKALGKLYFIKEKETIITKLFQEKIKDNFFMPKSIEDIKLEANIEPNYNIDAV